MICSAFGHREVYDRIELDELLGKLVKDKGVQLFLTGGMGEFDRRFVQAIRKVKQRDGAVRLALIKPYLTRELQENRLFYERDFDSVIVPEELAGIHPKAAIDCRNKWMIDQSDIVLFYVRREFGGAHRARQYAIRKEKLIIDI